MNERRSELMERVRVLLRGYLGSIGDCDAAGGSVTTMLHIEKGAAAEIIALVTAARDAEIRELLLSEGAVIEAVESIRTSPVLDRSSYNSLPPEGPGAGEPGKWLGHELRREWREYVGRPAIEAALDHIGLGDSDTGGQG